MGVSTPRIYFPRLRYPIKVSTHAKLRLKQRANLNTKKKRLAFLRGAAKNALTLSKIPRTTEFSSLIAYLKKVYKQIHKKNLYCMLFLYLDYIFVLSVDSTLITVLKVNDNYIGKYQAVKEYLENPPPKHQCNSEQEKNTRRVQESCNLQK